MMQTQWHNRCMYTLWQMRNILDKLLNIFVFHSHDVAQTHAQMNSREGNNIIRVTYEP